MTTYIKNGHTIEVPDIDPTVREGEGENFTATPQAMDALLREAGYTPEVTEQSAAADVLREVYQSVSYIEEGTVGNGTCNLFARKWSEPNRLLDIYDEDGENVIATYRVTATVEKVSK